MNLILSLVLAQSMTPTSVRQYKLWDGGVVPWVVTDSAMSTESPAMGIFGAQKVAQETPLEAITFQYGLNPEFVLTTSADGGSVTQANSSAIMATGTQDGGLAQIRSTRLTRYVPGQGIRLRFTAVFSTCRAQSTQEVGLGNDSDFLGFGCVGATFGVIHRVGGVQTFVAKSAWNGTPITFDITKGNVMSLAYQWLGYGVARFVIEKPDGTFVTVHTFQFPNSRTTPTLGNPALRFRARVNNWGNATNLSLSVPSVGIVTEGLKPNGGISRGTLNRRIVTTAPLNVLSLRNNATFGDAGVENRVRIRLVDVHTSGTGSGDVNCIMVEDAAIPGTDFRNIDLSRSVASVDIDGGTVDGGQLRHAWVFEGSGGGSTMDFADTHLEPGQTMSVACWAQTGNSTTGVAVNWVEEF